MVNHQMAICVFLIEAQMSELKDRIREASEEVDGLKQLAELIHVPRRTLGHWLTGKKPKPEALAKIAEVTGVSLDWLMTGDGYKHQNALSDAFARQDRAQGANQQQMTDEEFQDRFRKALSRTQRSLSDPEKPPAFFMIDESLMEKLARIVTSVYREAGHAIPPEKVTVEATKMMNELATLVGLDDIAGVELALPVLRHRLTVRLSEATSEPGSGKRSA